MAMTQELLVCPYCNAQIPHPLSEQANQPVICPRCEETFALRHAKTAVVEGSVGEAPTPQPRVFGSLVHLFIASVVLLAVSVTLKFALPDVKLTQQGFPFGLLLGAIGMVASLWLWFFQRRRSNATVATFVLGNMAVVAMVVLPFALATTSFRRGNDPRRPEIDGGAPRPSSGPEILAPARLPGLGYLPDDCNVVAGIHVAELAEYPIGPKFLSKPAADVVDAEQRPWLVEQGLGFVEKYAGLRAEEIDHLVFGLKSDGFLPRVTVVVRTRQPYEPARVAQAQAPVVPVKHLGNHLYQFKMRPVGDASLWCADSRTLVLMLRLDGLLARDKQLLTESPRQGLQAPPQPVRRIVSTMLAAGTPIWWAASDLDHPEMVANLLPVGEKDSELAKLLQKTANLTAGLRLQKDPAVLANIECPDTKAARRLAELLHTQTFAGLGTPEVAGPPQGSAERWVSVQFRGSPDAVVRALRPVRLLGPGGKS